MDVKRDITRIIRKIKPDVVVTMDPSMLYDAERGFINHPDHRAAGQAALDAVYPLARDHMSFPELYQNERLQPHNVATVLLTNFDKQNFFMDITGCMDTKIAALAAHASQVPDLAATEEWIKQMAEKSGQLSGESYKYAEGFIRVDIR
jgi:LmbE family N-acetylglucosaminyl deacetylase